MVTRPRLLLVDDHALMAEGLRAMLEPDHEVVGVISDGREVLAGVEIHRPDIVLLDLGLPRLNGFDTCRRIRQQPWGARMKLVAITGWGQEDYRRRSEEAGFDDHLVKPVHPPQILELIATTLAPS